MKSKFAVIGLILAFCAELSFGAAATSAINTPSRSGYKVNVGVYTNTIIYAGTIVCLNSSGYAIAGADASGNVVIGRASKTVDNRDSNPSGLASSSGAQTIEVERGVFGWTASGTCISDTTIGSFAYVLDSQTVTNASAGNSIIAGIIVDWDGTYAWVDTYAVPRTAGSYTTISASGAATLGSTLTVTGPQTFVGVSSNNNIVCATNASVGGKLDVTGPVTVTGAQTNNSTLKVVGLATMNNITLATNLAYSASSGNVTHNGNFTINTNATITGTSLHTGVASFTAVPSFNAALGTPGAVAGLVTNLPTSATADAIWLKFTHNGTNVWIPAFPTN